MLYVIGDSHTLRLLNAHYDQKPNEDCYWVPTGKEDSEVGIRVEPVNSKCEDFHCGIITQYEQDIYCSGFPGASAYTSSYRNRNFPCIKEKINKDNNAIVLPYFGYIDAKQHFPFTKNPEFTAIKYVDQTLNYFEGKNIRFISPLPQFKNDLGSGRPFFPFEERFETDQIFKKTLNEYLKSLGMKEAISVEKILGTNILDESFECHDCRDCLSLRYKEHRLDHLKQDFSLQVMEGILKEIL